MGPIQAASGCIQRAVDRCFLTPLEAYTGLKTYQDAYFESPLFNSGKGYSPLRWFEDDLYLEDLNNWKSKISVLKSQSRIKNLKSKI